MMAKMMTTLLMMIIHSVEKEIDNPRDERLLNEIEPPSEKMSYMDNKNPKHFISLQTP